MLAGVFCILAFGVTLYDFTRSAATMSSAVAILAIALVALSSEQAFRTFWPDPESATSGETIGAEEYVSKARTFSRNGYTIVASILAVLSIGGLAFIKSSVSKREAPTTNPADHEAPQIGVTPAKAVDSKPTPAVDRDPPDAAPIKSAPVAPATVQRAADTPAAKTAPKPHKKRKR